MSLLLIIMALLQDSGAPRSESGESVISAGLSQKTLPLSRIVELSASGAYRSIPRDQLAQLIQHQKGEHPATRPGIRDARYSATLSGTLLTEAALECDLYEDSQNPDGTLVLGRTGLEQLRLNDAAGPLNPLANADGQLVLKMSGASSRIQGTWAAEGVMQGDALTFRLELLPSTTTEFVLTTDSETLVSSAGCLVLSQPASGAVRRWQLIPEDPSRIILTCRRHSGPAAGTPLALPSFSASHVLKSDILSSRWTLAVPPEMEAGTQITTRISSNVRVSEIRLDDQNPVEWSLTEDGPSRLISMRVSESAVGNTITVTSAVVIPQTDTWELPLLSPVSWQSEARGVRGPLLMSASPLSVILPSSIHIDEWTLKGIQERDVVSAPNESREYQLVQFQTDATALMRTSVSPPVLSDSLVTVLEPAGRLAMVRCFVEVQCDVTGVVELNWPVAAGWQVISARYADTGQALFFETGQPDQQAGQIPLTIHLPEDLEPQTRQVLAIQFQQTQAIPAGKLSLPLLQGAGIQRTGSALLFMPGPAGVSELQRSWTFGRTVIAMETFSSRFAWFPASEIVDGLQCCSMGDSDLIPHTQNEGPVSSAARVEHAVRLIDGQIVEDSRIVIPITMMNSPLISLVSADAPDDMKWTVAGEPVPAQLLEDSGAAPGWNSWSIPLTASAGASEIIVTCQARRAASDNLTAAVPFPQLPDVAPGSIELFSIEDMTMTAPGLTAASSRSAASPLLTTWTLPAAAEPVRIQLKASSRIQAGQTIDVHMLHITGEQSGALEEEIVAVATITRRSGARMLPLNLPDALPLVLVNGHRVELQKSASGYLIPLPEGSGECQVVVVWKSAARQADQVLGERQLPRLFADENVSPQCTHHLLISPELDVRAGQSPFAVTEPTDILQIVGKLLNTQAAPSGTPPVPPEIRRFITRWQVASAEGWQQRTLIDSTANDAPLVIQITQLRRTFAISSGVAMAAAAMVIAMRRLTQPGMRHVAILSLIVLAAGYLMTHPVAEAALHGVFWGMTAGQIVLLTSRWNWIRTVGWHSLFRPATGIAATLLVSHSCYGQSAAISPSLLRAGRVSETRADILVPDQTLTNSQIVFVRSDLLSSLMSSSSVHAIESSETPLVHSVAAVVSAESADSIELLLTVQVSVPISDQPQYVRLPVQGTRLVDVRVDDQPVLPDADGDDAILVPIAASIALPPVVLTPRTDQSEVSVAAPGPVFSEHRIVCRLRPVLDRQTTGVQFQIPFHPSPSVSLQVNSETTEFSHVRMQVTGRIHEYNPGGDPVVFNGLADADPIPVRLIFSDAQSRISQQAQTECLIISESTNGLQTLGCWFRFRDWDRLNSDLTYYVPEGYRLTSVSSVNAGTSSELQWSVSDAVARISLPSEMQTEFTLALQLQAQKSETVLEQPVPVAEIPRFADTFSSPTVLVAARTQGVFSVLQPRGDQISPVAFSVVSAEWGTWLRRTDSLFRVPSGSPQCLLRFAPRQSLHEVRMAQSVTLRERSLDWTCRLDVETTILPVFRHRFRISPEIAIQDIQVTAGEANRIASWHRRGDQVIVLLREGTAGLHAITIRGQRTLGPDDDRIELPPPLVENGQSLESVLSITDQDGLAFSFDQNGGGKPDRIPEPDGVLKPGDSMRIQIVDNRPVILNRVQSVEPTGQIAVVRSTDRVQFFMNLRQWSGSLGPLHLRFSDDARFLSEPVILTEKEQLPLIREANEFVAGQDVVRTLFGQSEFTAVWSMPVPQNADQPDFSFPWPSTSDRIQWDAIQLVPLDEIPDRDGTRDLPPWLISAAERTMGKNLRTLLARAVNLEPDTLQNMSLTIPVRSAAETSVAGTQELYAVSNTTVLVRPWQSPAGQSEFLIFASRIPARCKLLIPPGTVVTELVSSAATRWDAADRRQVVIDLDRPVSSIRVRWLSQRAEGNWRSTRIQFEPPDAADYRSAGAVTVYSIPGETPSVNPALDLMNEQEMAETLQQHLETGIDHARSGDSASRDSRILSLTADTLRLDLAKSADDFLLAQQTKTGHQIVRCCPDPRTIIEISYHRRLEFTSILPIIVGLMMVIAASMTLAPFRPRNSEATPPDLSQNLPASGSMSAQDILSLKGSTAAAPSTDSQSAEPPNA